MTFQQTITLPTRNRGTYDITQQVQSVVQESGLSSGIAHIFIHHTSASLIICENAASAVRRDLETFMARVVPDGADWMEHQDEGPDDMPAHIRSILTQSSLSVPFAKNRCLLGTWQGIYVWEHRYHGHRRQITVTVQGQ